MDEDYKVPLWWLVVFGISCGMLGYMLACRDLGPDEHEPPVVEAVEIVEEE